jgi:alkylated DNA nucleotide flippase Atl1
VDMVVNDVQQTARTGSFRVIGSAGTAQVDETDESRARQW